jgi:ribonucleoside-diphosphate reductase beta chain
MEGYVMRVLQTTTERGLNQSILPMRLYQKAKKLGTWDPRDIDLTQDKEDWKGLSDGEKQYVLRLCSMFQAGEEAVTRDLLPLVRVISLEGRLEEEMYLTTFLWEEAKHTEMFRIFLDDVVGIKRDITEFHGENYKKIFYEFLPEAMEALIHDPSPEAQAKASVTYNMIVEGTLAETGYHAFYTSLKRLNKMPGLISAIDYLKKDESRHIGYGTYLLSRLICEHENIWDVVNRHMENLLPYAIGVVNEIFVQNETMPFGLSIDEFINFAMKQFQSRMDTLERARTRSVDEIYLISEESVGVLK